MAILTSVLAPLAAFPTAAHASTGAGTYVPLAVRLLDTRTTTALAANSPRNIKVTGVGGVPTSGVSAVQVSLTALNYTKTCNIWATAGGGAAPGTSALNYSAAYSNAITNSAIVPVNQSTGQIEVSSCAPVDLLIDLQGYFATGSGTNGNGFVSVLPSRLADTRNGTGIAQARLSAGSTTTLQLTGTAGVPAQASSPRVTAAFLNITVLNYDDTHGSFLNAYAAGSSTPPTTLNFTASSVTAIGALVPVNASSGQFTIKLSSTLATPVDLLIDVEGYFSSASSDRSLTPYASRLYDSRQTTQLPALTGRRVQVSGVNGVPERSSGASIAMLNIQVVPSAAAHGYIEAFQDDMPDPDLSSVNFDAGVIRSNAISLGIGQDGGIFVFNHSNDAVDVVVDIEGFWTSTADQISAAPGPVLSDTDTTGLPEVTSTLTPTVLVQVPSSAGTTAAQNTEVYTAPNFDPATLVASCTSSYVPTPGPASCALNSALTNQSSYYARSRVLEASGAGEAWSSSFAFTVWTDTTDTTSPTYTASAASDEQGDFTDASYEFEKVSDSSPTNYQPFAYYAYCNLHPGKIHMRTVAMTVGNKPYTQCTQAVGRIYQNVSMRKSVWWWPAPVVVKDFYGRGNQNQSSYTQKNVEVHCSSSSLTTWSSLNTSYIIDRGVKYRIVTWAPAVRWNCGT